MTTPITTTAPAPIIIFLFLDTAMSVLDASPPKDEKSPLLGNCSVESLIPMETLQPTPLYAALFISVSIRCDKIRSHCKDLSRRHTSRTQLMPRNRPALGPHNGMDKTVRRQCSLTAWVRKLLKAFLKSSMTGANEVGGGHKARGRRQRNPGKGASF